jgi:diadenylate cyclase
MESKEGEKIEIEEKVEELFVPKTDVIQPKTLEKDFLDVLKMFAPGTSIRTALDDLLRAEMGALIVIDNGNIASVTEKGFKIHSRFSSQKLVELAKMDGAIIVSRNIKKILYANALLSPNPEISSKETGTRHKAAERTSKQTSAIVVAVSERKNKITIYYGDWRHELKASSEILRRAAETLQILEKQRESYDDAMNNLNLLELRRMVTINDVSLVIQRLEILERVSDIVKRYLVELGREGAIVSMRLKDLTKGLDKEEELLLRDYFSDVSFVKDVLDKMDFDFLLETPNISRILFEELHDKPISPKGYRVLSKINILDRYIDSLVGRFKNLDRILFATEEELLDVFENEGQVSFFKEEIYNLREKIRVGKKI